MSDLEELAKQTEGHDADDLWLTEQVLARPLAAFQESPAERTARRMTRVLAAGFLIALAIILFLLYND